jgi:hypothetical protein
MASGIKLKTLPAVTVSSAGTAVPLYSTPLLVYGVTIVSLSENSGTQFIGDSTVDVDNGMPISPGDTCEIDPPQRAVATDQFYINEVYVDSSEDGAEFRVIAWIRE